MPFTSNTKKLPLLKILLAIFILIYLSSYYFPNTGMVYIFSNKIEPNFINRAAHFVISPLLNYFGISLLWIPFAIIFLERKTKIWIELLFYFLIISGVSVLAGILWNENLELLYYYFGGFALVSLNIFKAIYLKVLILVLNCYAIYLIITRYSFSKLTRKVITTLLIIYNCFRRLRNNKSNNFKNEKKYIPNKKKLDFSQQDLHLINIFFRLLRNLVNKLSFSLGNKKYLQKATSAKSRSSDCKTN